MTEVSFLFILLLTVGSALGVVLSRNLIYSAVFLLFTLLGIAGLYVFLWADFLAGVQIAIYIGGILVLILFGIMLTHKIVSVNISHSSLQRGVGGLLTLALIAFLSWIALRTPWRMVSSQEPLQTVGRIGQELMTNFLLPFEVASVLLLGALIGAALLSRRDT
ncbi:MAG: NADH-quinone oxidoreductase subunit J [Candidatus Neomarinimicrobiota bacterium]|nr:MAG: NADH-quinone oxidoreductase subunit J [Candidatus Neomarinimicrobiota bacterium]